jgi:protein gp37
VVKQHEGGISWTHFTFNPWWGCNKCSPACLNCYAERLSKRCGFDCFGSGKLARTFGEAHWNEPRKWNRKAKELGVRYRVFCGSMCDIFQQRNEIEIQMARAYLWRLIEETPHLDWLLLSKRPENAEMFIPQGWWGGWAENAWAGATVENQEAANKRIPSLLKLKAQRFFVSCEPLLGLINLHSIPAGNGTYYDLSYSSGSGLFDRQSHRIRDARIDWLIVGGESGPGARPMHPDWVRSLRDQAQAAGVPFHFKQWGEWVPSPCIDPHVKSSQEIDVNGVRMFRVGKKSSGRLLDGKEWLEFPEDKR